MSSKPKSYLNDKRAYGGGIEYWNNNKNGAVKFNIDDISHRFIEYEVSENRTNIRLKINEKDRNDTNCPVVSKGIVSFVIMRYGKEEKLIFDTYYERCLERYKKEEAVKPGASLRNLDAEFNENHIREEREKIEFSKEHLREFIYREDMRLLTNYANSYLTYIKRSYDDSAEPDELCSSFCTKMPVYIPEKHFYVLVANNSTNGYPFLTIEAFKNFIDRAFRGKNNIKKIKLNHTNREYGMIKEVFHRFYSDTCVEYLGSTHVKDEYVKLLSDNFDNWTFERAGQDFHKSVKKSLYQTKN